MNRDEVKALIADIQSSIVNKPSYCHTILWRVGFICGLKHTGALSEFDWDVLLDDVDAGKGEAELAAISREVDHDD